MLKLGLAVLFASIGFAACAADIPTDPSNFSANYAAMAEGDRLIMEAGNYGGMDFNDCPVGATQHRVLVGAANHATVFDGKVNIGGGCFVEFDGIRFTQQIDTGGRAHDFIFRDVDCTTCEANNVHNFSFIGGTYSRITMASDFAGHVTNDILIDGVTFRDGVTNDTIQCVGNAYNLTIRNSFFGDFTGTNPASHFDYIQCLQNFSTGETPHTITIEGNFFGDDCAGTPDPTNVTATVFLSDGNEAGGGYHDIVIRNNFGNSCGHHGLVIHHTTGTNIVFENNTMVDAYAIGSTATEAVPGFLNNVGTAGITNNTGMALDASNELNADLATCFPNYTNGATPDQYVAAAGSVCETNGAYQRIAEVNGSPPPPPPPSDSLTLTAVFCDFGAAVIEADQTITYTPSTGFAGDAVCTYTAEDEAGQSDTATLTITVAQAPPPANPPPILNNDAVNTPHDTPVTVDVLANDDPGIPS